jgi:hypothetical protein
MVSLDNRRFAWFRPALGSLQRGKLQPGLREGERVQARATNRKFGVAAPDPFEIGESARYSKLFFRSS